MEMLAGRWATAEPTAAARAILLRNMLAMIFNGQSRRSEMYLLWVRGASAAVCGCERVMLMVDGEARRSNATTKVREELYLGRDWNGKSEGDKGKCLPFPSSW
jgi:hypothetical protein